MVPLDGFLKAPYHDVYKVIRHVGCIIFITVRRVILQVSKHIYINPEYVCLIGWRMLWPRSLSCTGLPIQLETGGGKSSCKVVEQYGCVSKAEVESTWVRPSAMTDATFDLL